MDNIIFNLYNQFNSSFFDLIEGNFETKQTKGLGVLLSKSPIFLKTFLNLKKINSNFKIDSIESYDRIVVNCELASNENKRIDILIRFFKNYKLNKVIIIEAKTISKNIDFFSAKKQLNQYVENHFKYLFEDIENENILKIVLTKYENTENSDNTISMAWDDILNALYQIKPKSNNIETQLCRDYFYFLTKINGSMKFYEKEVYSIPSANWSQDLINRFNVYECLNKGKYVIKKKPLYITFRKSGGGQMERLYKIDDIIILKPKSDLESFLNSDYDINKRKSIEKYCEFMTNDENGHWKDGLPNDERQFIILSNQNNIELPSCPKPKRNNSFRAYYTLSEILNNTIGKGENVEEE
mgnify:CR=1 FL=1|jgi:hypothetical protein